MELNQELVEQIRKLKAEHPFWGYRRVTAWLKHREGYQVNHKKIYRLMKENGLLVEQKRYKAKRVRQRSKPKARRPKELWGIDMTKFMIPTLGWSYLVLVVDWYTKKIVGWKASLRARTKEWKDALEMALSREFPEGVRGQGLKLVSDNGSQPTSTSFMRDTSTLGVEQIFCSYDNPKGNAETERMMRTLKEELLWLNEYRSLEEAREAIRDWVEYYNEFYVHSALGYLSPNEFSQLWESQQSDIHLPEARIS